MKKAFLFFVLMLLQMSLGHAQLLYKVTGNQLQRPSYVIGTFHLADASFVDSVPGARKALEDCEQVYGELKWDDMMNPDSIAYIQKAMLMPGDSTLKQVLTQEQYQKLNNVLTELIHADLTNPMMESQMGRMTPTAMTTQLTTLLYLLNADKPVNMSNLFDAYFQSYAKEHGKTIGGLETLAFETSVLLKSQSMKRQVELLMCFVDNLDYQRLMAEELKKAFFSQNLKSIEQLTEEKRNDQCDSSPEEDSLLIYGRNASWLAQMPDIMLRKSTLFVVGAAHLVGEKGILEGLRQLGYKVEAVN